MIRTGMDYAVIEKEQLTLEGNQTGCALGMLGSCEHGKTADMRNMLGLIRYTAVNL